MTTKIGAFTITIDEDCDGDFTGALVETSSGHRYASVFGIDADAMLADLTAQAQRIAARVTDWL
jgi:hypothetical protein